MVKATDSIINFFVGPYGTVTKLILLYRDINNTNFARDIRLDHLQSVYSVNRLLVFACENRASDLSHIEHIFGRLKWHRNEM